MNITELIKSRRTIRKFEQKEIDIEKLEKYVDVARVAPSAANLQPLKYVIVQSKDMVEKMFPLVKWAGYLAPLYNPKEDERPAAYIVVCGDNDIRREGYDQDVGAAVENIILCALSDGIGTCWMGSVEREKVRELLNIPDNLVISCVLAMGYPKEEPKEVKIKTDIKYYLEEETLCVPKRSQSDVLIKTV